MVKRKSQTPLPNGQEMLAENVKTLSPPLELAWELNEAGF